MAIGAIPQQYAPIGDPTKQRAKSIAKVRTQGDNARQWLTYTLPAVLAGAVDDIGQSFGIIKDEQTIQNMLNETLGTEMSNFYAMNKEGFKLAGSLSTSLIPIFTVPKLLKTTSIMNKAIRAIPGGKPLSRLIATSGKSRQDRVMEIAEKAKVLRREGAIDLAQDPVALKAIRLAKLGAMVDSLRENVMIDAALYGMYNEQDFFFPAQDSPMTNLALYGTFDAAFALGAYKFAGAAIARSLADVDKFAKEASRMRNRSGILTTQVLSTPNNRGVSMTESAVKFNEGKLLLSNPEYSQGARSAAQDRIGAARENIAKQTKLAGKDVLFDNKVLDTSYTFDAKDGEIQTVLHAVTQEPSLAPATLSMQPIIRGMDKTIPEEVDAISKSLAADIEMLNSKIAATEAGVSTFTKDGVEQMTYPFLSDKQIAEHNANIKKLDELQAEKWKTENSIPTVWEVDGSVTPLQSRPFTSMDNPASVEVVKSIEGVELAGDRAVKIGMHIGFTNDMSMIIKPAIPTAELNVASKTVKEFNLESEVINGVKVARVLSPMDIKREMDNAVSFNMIDMTFAYAQSGRIGKDLYANMPSEFRKALSDWKGASRDSQIRGWSKNNPAKLIEMQNVFKNAGLHKKLYELADENGMVPMYRGESKRTDITKVGADVVSMTPNAAYAAEAWGKGVGRTTVRVNVSIEDIIGVIDHGTTVSKFDAFGQIKKGTYDIGHEFEFIVKGNKSRISVVKKRTQLMQSRGKQTAEDIVQPYAEQKRLDFQSMNLDQAADGWVLAQNAVKSYKPEVRQLADGSVVGSINMDMSKNFMEVDATLALMDKFPDDPIANWLPKAGLPRDQIYRELQFLSLSKKFTAYAKERNVQTGGEFNFLKLPENLRLSTNSLMRKLNLPNDTGVGKHPLVQMFDAFNPGVGKEVPELRDFVKNMDEVDAALESFVTEGKLVEGRQLVEDYSLQGISLRSDLLDDRKPVMVWQQNVSQNRLGAEQINELIATKRAERFVQLNDAEASNAGYVAAWMAGIQSDGKLFEQATSPQYLIEGMQRGEGFGTTAAFNARGIASIQAADILGDRAGKQGLVYVAKDVFNDESVMLFNKLATDKNSGSLQPLEMAMSEARNGWVAVREPISLGDGKYALQLDGNSKRNAQLWEELTGRNFKEDLKAAGGKLAMPIRMTMDAKTKLMPKPAVMDQMALDGHAAVTRISHMYLDNENFLRSIKGLSAIPKREWHVPFYNEAGAKVMYMVDNEGVVISQFVGATQDEALRLAEAELKQRQGKGEMVALQSEEYVKRHIKTAGYEFEARVNFGRAGVQTGSAKGKTGTIVSQLGTLENTLGQLQRNFTDLQQRTAGVVFESELNYLRQIYESMSQSAQKRAEGTTIFQQLERAYLQTSSLSAEEAIGKLYYGIEDSADMYFAKMWDKYHTFIPQSTNPTMKEFARLNESLGKEYNPFKTFEEFLTKTEKATIPPTLRSMGSGFNKLATNLVLRIFDLGMPLINIASVAGVAPAVTAALRPIKGESVMAWKRRTNLIGSPISDTMAIPNVARLQMTAVHGLFDGETRAAMKLATRKYGLMKQEVAERIDLMTAPMESYGKRNLRAIVDFMSLPTDKSEELSRALSFSMFYNVGRKSMKLGKEDAITFAHKQANDVVGDYRATNRPKIFQGATGMPLGLFTTWAWNFMQRIYGDLEGGRLGAVATQAFVHAFLFGGEAMPGYDPLINTLTTSYDGTRNLIDVVDEAWGSTATDFLLTGTLANAPKMFGLEDGIAIQNRAALGVPALFQGISEGSMGDAIPAYRVLSTLTEGAGRIADSLMNLGTNTPQEIAETFANFGVNGSIKTAAEMSLGYSTNRAGELINANVRRLPEVIARTFELKTLRENRIRQEFSRDKLREATKADHMRSLSRRVRTAARSGNLTNEVIQDVGEKYIRAGGSGDNLRSYLKQQIIAGQYSKDSRLLVEKLGAANDLAGLRRLIELQQDDNGY